MPKDYIYSPIHRFNQKNNMSVSKNQLTWNHYYVGVEVRGGYIGSGKSSRKHLVDMGPTMTRDQYLDKMVAEQKIDPMKLEELKKQFSPVKAL